MIKIAICDDEVEICFDLENKITQLLEAQKYEFNIELFFASEKLLEKLKAREIYDIIFLDIEFEGMGGVELGNIIRSEINDNITKIVYISWKDKYAMNLFDIRPFNFLIKPLKIEEIKRVIGKAISFIENEDYFFGFKINNEYHKIQFKDIIFFESDNRKVIMHAITGTFSFYGKLDEIMDQLNNENFWRIHKSYIVNYTNIRMFEYDQLKTIDGKVLPVSQSKKVEIREKQMIFNERKYHENKLL